MYGAYNLKKYNQNIYHKLYLNVIIKVPERLIFEIFLL